MFPSIEPSETGNTGLFWLISTYGYALFYASNLISEGSDLLMLIPSLAGLVGGTVLPLLGAIPDGAIMLFSGLGDIDTAQETLSVGVGALAGSTIMLLTVPWFLSVNAGRVSFVAKHGKKTLNYHGKPKLKPELKDGSGIQLTSEIKHGAVIMMATLIPYLLIQIPASLIGRSDEAELAAKEKWYALIAFFICVTGFVSYLYIQVKMSGNGEDQGTRVAVMKKLISTGDVSLSSALSDAICCAASEEEKKGMEHAVRYYQSMSKHYETGSNFEIPHDVKNLLGELLVDLFRKYDIDRSGNLDKVETNALLIDLHEVVPMAEIDATFTKYDTDNDGTINYDEFMSAIYGIIMRRFHRKKLDTLAGEPKNLESISKDDSYMVDEEPSEEEEMPHEFKQLTPAEQKKAILLRSFSMLTMGTAIVLIFSDPMVDVLSEVAVRTNIPPFYVSFILSPMASNASEVIASMYYASKKTRKTISVSLNALEGAASMNNTFCLAIFMGLIYFRGLAWEYTAETISIVVVQLIVGFMVLRSDVMTVTDASIILSLFPLSILFIATMEALGFD